MDLVQAVPAMMAASIALAMAARLADLPCAAAPVGLGSGVALPAESEIEEEALSRITQELGLEEGRLRGAPG